MLAVTATLLGLAALGVPQQQSVAGEVAVLLQQRCASCHSADSDQAKARRKWDDANDLAATATNPKLVVLGNLDESELYQTLDFGDMPPEDSDVAPFTPEEIALVARWIEEGAQLPSHPFEAAEPVDGAAGQVDGEQGPSLVRLISHLHPTIVHFPIALLLCAALAEALVRVRPKWGTHSAADFCVALGAISAIPSAALGWLLAANSIHSGDTLELHRYMGTTVAVLAPLVWWAGNRWPGRRLVMLIALAGVIGYVGHTGGVLSFGADWLPLPF